MVRHKVKVEGLSVREVARHLGISRNTVRRCAKGAAVLGRRQERPGGKQRLTATQLYRMVVGEDTWSA